MTTRSLHEPPPLGAGPLSAERPSARGLSGGCHVARRRARGYLFASLWPMISCAVKLMPQVGNALPTKKLSDCAE